MAHWLDWSRRLALRWFGVRRPVRKQRSGPRLEALETRELPAGGMFDVVSIAAAFNEGTSAIRNRGALTAQDTLGIDLPLVRETIAGALDVQTRFREPFKVTLDSSRAMAAQLQAGGLKVEYLGTTPDAAGDLLRVRYDKHWKSIGGSMSLGESAGFDYLDNVVQGRIDGRMNARARDIVFQAVFGVDTLGGRPTFYLSDASSFGVNALTGKGTAAGTFDLGVLKGVQAKGTAELNLAGSIRFRDSDSDHRLRPGDLRSGRAYVGDVDGSIKLNDVKFNASIPSIASLGWQGAWTADIRDNQMTSREKLTTPAPLDLARGLANGLFAMTGKLDYLGHLRDILGKKVPVIGKTVSDLLGIDKKIAPITLATNPGSFSGLNYDQIKGKLSGLGVSLLVGPESSSALLGQLIRGVRVDLVTYEKSGTLALLAPRQSFPLYDNTWLSVIEAKLNAFVEAGLDLSYLLKLGIDSTGFYLDPGSNFTANGRANAGIEGKLKLRVPILGTIASVKGEGSLGLTGNLAIGLVDPHPEDGRLYSWEFLGVASNPAGFLGVLRTDLTVDLEAHVKAKISPKISFGKDFNLARLFEIHRGPIVFL